MTRVLQKNFVIQLTCLLTAIILSLQAHATDETISENSWRESRTLHFSDDCLRDRQNEYGGTAGRLWKPGAWHLSADSRIWPILETGRSFNAKFRLRFQRPSKDLKEVETQFHIPCGTKNAIVVILNSSTIESEPATTITISHWDLSQKPLVSNVLRRGVMKGFLPDGIWQVDFHFGKVSVFHENHLLISGYVKYERLVAGIIVSQDSGALIIESIEVDAEPRERALFPADQRGEIEIALETFTESRKLSAEDDYVEAARLGKEAFSKLKSALGDRHPWTIEVLAHTGFCEYRLADGISEGRAKLTTALTLAQQVLGPQHPQVAEIWVKLGSFRLEFGDGPAALRAYSSALEILEETHGRLSAEFVTTAIQAAGAAMSSNDLKSAEDYSVRALAAARSLWPEGDAFTGVAIEHLARIYTQTDRREEARKLLAERIDIAERIGTTADRMTAHVSRAELAFAARDFAMAKSDYEAALEEARKSNGRDRLPQITLLVVLGLVEHELGNKPASISRAEEAYRVAKEAFPNDDFQLGRAESSLAAAVQMAGDFPRAFHLLESSLDRHIKWLTESTATASTAESREAAMTLYLDRESYLSMARRVETLQPRDVYGRVWQCSGVVRRQQEANRQLAKQSPEFQKMRADLIELSSRLSALQSAPESTERTAVESLILEQKEQLESRIRRDFNSSQREQPPALAVFEQWIDRFPDRTALIHIVRASRRDNNDAPYDIFVVSRSGQAKPDIDWITIRDGEHLEANVLKALGEVVDGRAAMTRPNGSVLLPLGTSAHRNLKERLAAIDHLYVIPDGIFSQIPWTSLQEVCSDLPWSDSCQVSCLSHPQRICDVHAVATANEERRLLLVGNIDYGRAEDVHNVPAETGARHRRWPTLPGTAVELDTILSVVANRASTVVLRGEAATADAVLRQLPTTSIAHLATHGYGNFHGDRPKQTPLAVIGGENWSPGSVSSNGVSGMRSAMANTGLVMAGANHEMPRSRSGDHALLTGEQIQSLDLSKVQLVVLSACDTAAGTDAGSEGVFSLQQAFDVAGVRMTVASLWKVPDHAASLLMAHFYENMFQHQMPPLSALTSAQRWVRDHPGEIWRTASESDRQRPQSRGLKVIVDGPSPELLKSTPPYYWAGFVISGLIE